MPDALSSFSAVDALDPFSQRFAGETVDSAFSARPVARLDSSLGARSNSEIEGLLAEFSVQVTLTAFVTARDEIRRQNEQIIARLNEAREES